MNYASKIKPSDVWCPIGVIWDNLGNDQWFVRCKCENSDMAVVSLAQMLFLKGH